MTCPTCATLLDLIVETLTSSSETVTSQVFLLSILCYLVIILAASLLGGAAPAGKGILTQLSEFGKKISNVLDGLKINNDFHKPSPCNSTSTNTSDNGYSSQDNDPPSLSPPSQDKSLDSPATKKVLS
ncbi:hypothetical protein DSO57_1037281 [Entomophthora muscae]|uniref:Uncharacterized protein n=1 Tax=Entomophthora muscae TaxID=34485 RepID=A0ACC2S1E9_9FUNG|nr:hypothetical protein DSO57_1037281 [Entomophthora muscae]